MNSFIIISFTSFFFLFQPPFDKNGVDSPVDGQKYNSENASTSLGTSIDSAMVTASTTFAKNRFLSGDHVNANHARDALLRRQLFAIGKWLLRLALFFSILFFRERIKVLDDPPLLQEI